MLTLLLPGKKSSRVSLGSLLLTGVLAASVFTAVPASGSEFPSWEQVEQAKQDVESKAAQVAEIEALLGSLSAQAGSLGTEAVQASALHQRAVEEAEANSRTVDILAAQRIEASGTASELTGQLGALAAQTYKTGGMDSGLLMLLDADAAVGTMDRLTTLQGLSSRTDSLQVQAASAAKVLSSLEEREAAALAVREESAAESLRLAAEAETAAAAADSAVREAQERSGVLLEQLAELRDSSAQVEAERLKGQQAEETYRLQQAAREAEEAARNAEEQRGADNDGAGNLTPPPAAGEPNPVINPTPARPNPPSTPVPSAPAAPPAPPVPQPAPAPKPAPGPSPAPAPRPVDDPAAAQAYASGRLGAHGWGQDQFRCLVNLWQRESGWRTSANNPYSGAYGIPQSLPGDKMASVGADWRTNYRTQIEWGLGYIGSRYGSPCAAWQHSEDKNWY
ncbi:coiled-coil domain-containing protein [Arthrobacter gengyunqii]|uniref:Lytic transglycosylase domain-containing protein n=1 Tax=Arthrobacter gengyunqii TaxID=2886940 RepID=A0ABS8GIA3_9MICC|nr:lytic transglycosylase domain-containing protein [Arthrobacter gengyunqii]MCC3266386.1 lytic transglycosylase domain-containing protein [Arthrobacter gengyunqii]